MVPQGALGPLPPRTFVRRGTHRRERRPRMASTDGGEQRWNMMEVAEVAGGRVAGRWAFIDRLDELSRFLAQAST